MVLKETVTKCTPLGFSLFYVGDAYQKAHGGRSPQEDGLKPESYTLPNGTRAVGTKVGSMWPWPRSV